MTLPPGIVGLAFRRRRAVRRRQDLTVHVRHRVIEEERPMAMSLQPGRRVLVQEVRDILVVLHLDGLAVDDIAVGVAAHLPALGHRLGDLTVPVHAAPLEMEVMVETPLGRIARGRKLAPLTDHGRGVTRLLEHRGNHPFGLLAGAEDRLASILADGAGAEGVAAGQNQSPRRAAKRDGVETGKTHASLGQRIDVRRLVAVGSIAAQLGEAQVVGQDEEDVRLRGWRRWRGTACGAETEQGED